ncbi:MAG: TlyA family RNA methyltransferase [Clostridia bacterium]|nr:TlyA family RNA methyltransferase [Clostridia bacterium]
MRADVYLYQFGYLRSRQNAKTLIDEKNVKIDGKIINKASYNIDESIGHMVEIIHYCPYVSRGGLKLEGIIKSAEIDISGKICADIGASSGGFTDCLLKHGAKRVYAIDSGTNQLDLSLRKNKCVISLENFNARYLNYELIGELVDVITIDVSFISQTLIMPSAFSILNENGIYISLIKPQFEVGRANIGKGGIVKDKNAHLLAIAKVIECAEANSFFCTHLIVSPIPGGDGNTEYLAVFSRHGKRIDNDLIKKLIHK